MLLPPAMLSCPVAPPSQRELRKDGGSGGGGVARRARAAQAPKAKSCATSCDTSSTTSSATPCAASFTCSSFTCHPRKAWGRYAFVSFYSHARPGVGGVPTSTSGLRMQGCQCSTLPPQLLLLASKAARRSVISAARCSTAWRLSSRERARPLRSRQPPYGCAPVRLGAVLQPETETRNEARDE